jgi:hypothetical protein
VGDRLEVLRERQNGSRLLRYRRRFDTWLCRTLGSDQELSVVAAAPSRQPSASFSAERSEGCSFWLDAAARVGTGAG